MFSILDVEQTTAKDFANLREQGTELKQTIAQLELTLKATEERLQEIALQLPNDTHPDVVRPLVHRLLLTCAKLVRVS